MIREISKFKQDVTSYLETLENNPDIDRNETLGHFIQSHGYSELFQKAYLVYDASPFYNVFNKEVFLSLECVNQQNLGETQRPYCVTLNPPHTPEHMLLKWTTSHPVPSVAASRASSELYQIQGKRGIWFCGAYQGYGFHEDGLKAGTIAAQGLLKKNFSILKNPKQMVPTWAETGARLLVATQGDLGLADAFIHGDFSFVDKNDGLLNLFMIFVNNRDLKASVTRSTAVSSAKYFIRCVSNQYTLTQARRNISRHYDLSNELFSLFLDETMTYSCAIFTSEEEDLKVAQERKISLLIEKAKVKKEHHILEIGCGWGSLAVEVVKQTGCKYTGINLSEQQLKYAKLRVQQAGFQDHITFLLCDLSPIAKYI
ncbi:hypothetical protein H5410_048668 [Solanum commersonii]|uniref:Cyclopropane-fatty-acyl-phospholipid synthase n=1 Tax=Solanum commersonii TaxID=4109 RepID=A0A9J5XKG9_SOLCO|nr:hypothetical protein H5410_048668 [Solanum commersonii]